MFTGVRATLHAPVLKSHSPRQVQTCCSCWTPAAYFLRGDCRPLSSRGKLAAVIAAHRVAFSMSVALATTSRNILPLRSSSSRACGLHSFSGRRGEGGRREGGPGELCAVHTRRAPWFGQSTAPFRANAQRCQLRIERSRQGDAVRGGHERPSPRTAWGQLHGDVNMCNWRNDRARACPQTSCASCQSRITGGASWTRTPFPRKVAL